MSDLRRRAMMARASGANGPGNLTYTKTTVRPTAERGRGTGQGGVPDLLDYFYSLLPSDYVFARLSLAEQDLDNISNYFLIDAVVSASATKNSFAYGVRVFNHAKANLTVTNNPTQWSFIVSPDYTYNLEVWTGDYLV